MQEEISSCFNIIIPEIDESLSFKKYKDVKAIVKDIAKRKCLKIAKDYPNDLVIAADTVVVIHQKIIGIDYRFQIFKICYIIILRSDYL